MTIGKAIEIKTRTGEEFLKTDSAEIDEADRLSIEALKRIDNQRSTHAWKPETLLPGETESERR